MKSDRTQNHDITKTVHEGENKTAQKPMKPIINVNLYMAQRKIYEIL